MCQFIWETRHVLFFKASNFHLEVAMLDFSSLGRSTPRYRRGSRPPIVEKHSHTLLAISPQPWRALGIANHGSFHHSQIARLLHGLRYLLSLASSALASIAYSAALKWIQRTAPHPLVLQKTPRLIARAVEHVRYTLSLGGQKNMPAPL